MNSPQPFVIYDKNIRWLAAVNMAFVVGGIVIAVRVCSGSGLYLAVGFLGLYSLFWIRDLIFGMKLKLVSDGQSLHWQDRKKTGSVPLAGIQKILIGAKRPVQVGENSLDWTYVTLQLNSGARHDLPPNLAQGLRARKWRKLKELVAQLRTVSTVKVEQINKPDVDLGGWEDEPKKAAAKTDTNLLTADERG